MGEPDENNDGPVDAEPEELGSAGPWHNVPRESTDELVMPSAQVADPPRMPLAVKIGGLVLVGVLLLLAAWLGLTLGGSSNAPSPTPTVDESLWPLEPPKTLGNLVQGVASASPAATPGDRDIVRADYSDGAAKVVLLLSRPEGDLASYLKDAGVENVQPIGDASCGISVDNTIPVCARVIDDTAIAVAGLTEQNFEQIASLVDSFYRALR